MTNLVAENPNGGRGRNFVWTKPHCGQTGGNAEYKDLSDGADRLRKEEQRKPVRVNGGAFEQRPRRIEKRSEDCDDAETVSIEEPGRWKDEWNVG